MWSHNRYWTRSYVLVMFPLSQIDKKPLKDFLDYSELYSYFDKLQRRARKEVNGIYLECDTCRNYEDGICSGGCLAHILNSFQKEGNIREV